MLKHLTSLTPLARVLRARRFWWATPLVMPGLALANPTGGQVTTGSATITTPGANTVQIDQATASASINWQTFSIANNEYVIFNQPSASAVVLNRVIGNSASEIFGHLTANGRVFLVNPLGVVFAPGSQVDVGALVASTMDISDADFSSGRYVFTSNGSTAGITNGGRITTAAGGFVVLAGDYVNNTGIVQAQVGQVVLASGSAMTLSIGGNGLINYQVDQAALSDRAGVSNSGQLLADGGRVIMTAKVERSLLATVVNNEGLVQAHSISQGANGEIILEGEGGDVANSGTLDASGVNGANGGTVRLLGDGVTRLADTSNINVKGGGATALGGLVEVSGSTVNVRGAMGIGKGGTLLLDPSFVTITAGSGGFSSTAASGTVAQGFIESQLQSGANVTIAATKKITVADLSAYGNVIDGHNGSSTGGGLFLGIGQITGAGAGPYGGTRFGGSLGQGFVRAPGIAGGGIVFQGSNTGIIVDGALEVYGGSAAGNAITAPGNLVLQSNQNIVKVVGATVAAGAINIVGANGIDVGNVTAGNGASDTLDLTANNSGAAIKAGTLTAGDDITVQGAGLIAVGNVYGGAGSFADIAISHGGSNYGSITAGNLSAGGSIDVENFASGGIKVGAVNAGDDVYIATTGFSYGTIDATGAITAGTFVHVQANNGAVNLLDVTAGTGASDTINIQSAQAGAGIVTGKLTAGDDIYVSGSGPIQIGDAKAGNGTVSYADIQVLTNGSGLLQTGNLLAGENIYVSNFGGAVSIGNAYADQGGSLGVVHVFGAGNVTTGILTAGAAVSGSGNGTFTGNGNITALNGTVDLDFVQAITINGNVTGHHGSFSGAAVDIGGGGVTINGNVVAYGSADIYTGNPLPGFGGVTINGNLSTFGSPSHAGNIFVTAQGSYAQPESIVVTGTVNAQGARTVDFTASYGNITVHDVTVNGYGNGGTFALASFTAHGDGATYGNFNASGLNDTISVSNSGFQSVLSVTADGNISINRLNVTGGGGSAGFGRPDMAQAYLTAGGNVTLNNADIVGVARHNDFFGESSSGSVTQGSAVLNVTGANVTLGSNAGHVRVEGYGSAELVANAGGTITANDLTVIAHAGDEQTTGGFGPNFGFSSTAHFGSAEIYLRSNGNIVINGSVTETADGDLTFNVISHQGSVALDGPVVLTANPGTFSSSSHNHSQYFFSSTSYGSNTHTLTSYGTAGNIDIDIDGYSGVTVAGAVTARANGTLNVRMIGGCSSPNFGSFCSSFNQGPGGVSVTGALTLSDAGGTFHKASHSYGTQNGVAFDGTSTASAVGGVASLMFYGGGNVSMPGINLTNPGPVSLFAGSRNGSLTVNGNVTLLSRGGHSQFLHSFSSNGIVINSNSGSAPAGSAEFHAAAQYGAVSVGNIDVEGFGFAGVDIAGSTAAVGSVIVRAQEGFSSFISGGSPSLVEGVSPLNFGSSTSANARLVLDAGGYGADVGDSTTPGNVLVEGDDVVIGGTFTVNGGALRVHAGRAIFSMSSHVADITANAMSFAVAGSVDSYGVAQGFINLQNSVLTVGTGQVTLGSDPLQNLVLDTFTPLGAPTSVNPNIAFSAPDVALGTLNLQGDHIYIRADNLSYFGSVTQAQHDLYVFYDSFTPDADIHVDNTAGSFPGANFGVPGPYPGTTFVIGSTLTFSNVIVGANGALPLTGSLTENFVFLTNGTLTYLAQLSTTGVVVYTQPLIDLAALTYNPQLDQFQPAEDPNKKKDYEDTSQPTDPGTSDAGETHSETSSGLSCQ